MAAEARYLEEKKGEWDYFHYHDAKWTKVMEEIDEELVHFNVTERMNEWKMWSEGFLLFYKDVIANEVRGKVHGNGVPRYRYHSTKESFRNMHQLQRDDNTQKYEYEAQRLLSSILFHTRLSESEQMKWNKWILTGWFPHINFERLSEEAEFNYQSYAVRLLIGALYDRTTSIRSHEQQMKRIVEISVLAAALAIPGWIWSKIISRIEGLKDQLDNIFDGVNAEKRPLFHTSLNWDKSGVESSEESVYQELYLAFENEEILQVARMGIRLDEVKGGLPGWASQLLALCYALDPKWMAKLITPERNPFVFRSICSNPLYQHDLKLLLELAEVAGVWGRIEITKHILTLYNNRNNRLSYRLLLLLYVKKCFELLVQMNRADVLVLIVDRLIPWRIERGNGNIKWIGFCLGRVLQKTANPRLIQQMFELWRTPFIQGHELEYLLIEVRHTLHQKGECQKLLAQWDKGVINLWLQRLVPKYLAKERNSNDAFTYLENAVLPILIERYSKKGNLVMIIEKLIDRWFHIESEWFLGHDSEKKRRNGLLAALLVAIFVAANMETDLLGEPFNIKGTFENIYNITEDCRNWDADMESQIIQIPPVMAEMNKAVKIIISKL